MKSRIRSIAFGFAICIAVNAAAGCGGDKDTGDDQQDGKGSAGTDKIMFVDAGDPSKPVECGAKTCKGNDDGNPCCVNEKDEICGTIAENTQCLAVADPRCPSVEVKDLGMELTSCCRLDGMCGVVLVFGSGGCTDLGSEMFKSFNPDGPKPRRCDAKD
jgi:hypothetical protein